MTRPDEKDRRQVVVSAWVHYDEEYRTSYRSGSGRASRKAKRQQPAVSHVRGASFHCLSNAALSGPSNRLKASTRAYLEREMEPAADVLQDAPLEQWDERWSLWINPVIADANGFTIADVLTRELEARYGYHEDDVYVVEHTNEHGKHVHAVVPARDGVEITREDMASIGREVIKALELERQLDRCTGIER